MRRARLPVVAVVVLALLAAVRAAEPPPALVAVHGVVEKAERESVSVKPRGADGRFGKAVTLKVTGTSRVTLLSPQERGGKMVLTQREASAADLAAGQAVAAVYAEVPGSGPVL